MHMVFNALLAEFQHFGWSRFGLTRQDVRIYDRIVSVNGKAGSSASHVVALSFGSASCQNAALFG